MLWTTESPRGLGPGPDCQNALARQFRVARDPGSLTGSERSKIASMKLKIAVFAPTPSARESTASAVMPHLFVELFLKPAPVEIIGQPA